MEQWWTDGLRGVGTVGRGVKRRNGVLRGRVAGPHRPSTPGADLQLTVNLGPHLLPQAQGEPVPQ